MSKPPTRAPEPPPEPITDWTLTVPPPITPGLYEATVLGIEVRTAETDGREWMLWRFRLSDGRDVEGGSSFTISPRTKTYSWILALVGREFLAGGAVLHPIDLEGRPCTLNVAEDAEGLARVEAVLPPRAP